MARLRVAVAVLAAICPLLLVGAKAAYAQDDPLISAQCYSDPYTDIHPITVVSDGANCFICQQTVYSNNAYIDTDIIGHCSGGRLSGNIAYAYAANCKYGPYELVASGTGSFWGIPVYDSCGHVIDQFRLGYVQSNGSIYSPVGEPISSTWSNEDCDGDTEMSSPGAVHGSHYL